MSRLYAVFIVASIFLVGAFRLRRALARLLDERREVEDFMGMFGRFVSSRGRDMEAYGNLIERSYRIQGLLGSVGVMAHYTAPFRTHTVTNYHIILNALPAMLHDFSGYDVGQSSGHQQMIGECLLRYMGVSADAARDTQRDLQSPIAWFREGVAAILLFPISLLRSFGLLSAARGARVGRSTLFRLLSGLIGLLGLLSAIITIVLGWKQTVEVFRRFLSLR